MQQQNYESSNGQTLFKTKLLLSCLPLGYELKINFKEVQSFKYFFFFYSKEVELKYNVKIYIFIFVLRDIFFFLRDVSFFKSRLKDVEHQLETRGNEHRSLIMSLEERNVALQNAVREKQSEIEAFEVIFFTTNCPFFVFVTHQRKSLKIFFPLNFCFQCAKKYFFHQKLVFQKAQ